MNDTQEDYLSMFNVVIERCEENIDLISPIPMLLQSLADFKAKVQEIKDTSMEQGTVLTGIAIIMTIGVYGLVAGIVKLDDAGLYLSRALGEGGWAGFKRGLGAAILRAAPYLMRLLSVAGTAAMFLVGGGILTHGIPAVHHFIEATAANWGGVVGAVAPTLLDGVFGIVAGAVVLAVVTLVGKVWPKQKGAAAD